MLASSTLEACTWHFNIIISSIERVFVSFKSIYRLQLVWAVRLQALQFTYLTGLSLLRETHSCLASDIWVCIYQLCRQIELRFSFSFSLDMSLYRYVHVDYSQQPLCPTSLSSSSATSVLSGECRGDMLREGNYHTG